MNRLNLSLRQKKILHILQNQTSFVTGKKIASGLNVTARTIRSDIQELNQLLRSSGIRILSEQGKGYLLDAESPDMLKNLNQNETVFLSKEERIRYLAFQLCLSGCPLNLFDLEEEMYVSRTTLLSDIQTLKRRYTLKEPHIALIQQNHAISFEKNERRIRAVLLSLFYEDWDYNTKRNAYYGCFVLDEKILDFLMETVPRHLNRCHILMEDPGLVVLELSLSVMYHRICLGHFLPEDVPVPITDADAWKAVEGLFEDFEKKVRRRFPDVEKRAVYEFVSQEKLLDESVITRENASSYISPFAVEMADLFLDRIKRVFRIDFSDDDEFYIALLLYLRSLQNSHYIFYAQGNVNEVKKNLLPELEFAFLFQDTAYQFMNRRLTELELINMAFCLSGALEHHFTVHPEKNLKTVICCHMNLPAAWAVKRKVIAMYGHYLEVTDLLPVNIMNTFDFSRTDLILSTVKKDSGAGAQTLFLDSPADFNRFDFQGRIKMSAMNALCPKPEYPFEKLFQNAYWHENENFTERLPVIETMMSDFIRDEIASEKHLMEILNRESVSSFAFANDIVFLYSIIPAKQTQLSFLTLTHRISWGSQKIQTAVMAVFAREDRDLLFHLNNLFYHSPETENIQEFFHSIGIR